VVDWYHSEIEGWKYGGVQYQRRRSSPAGIEPITEAQARIARDAYRDFGPGRGHPAKLNFGDCFAYALAKAAGEPLLFNGRDFIHTDVTPALR
jgi:ribonuclease VapC